MDSISFDIDNPGIVGLLGNNGAGKSTLMKIITGLSRQTEGEVQIFDKDPWKNWGMVYKDLGVLFEPKIPGYLNNYEYLKQLCMLRDIDERKISETLDLVHLERSSKKVKDYSFGMVQRLGLAGSLLVQPKMLILDEPFVGLDPNGIDDLCRTLKSLADDGKSIFISSHQLSELDVLVDRILYLQEGVLKNDFPITGNKIHLKTTDNQNAFTILTDAGYQCVLNNNVIEVDGSENVTTEHIVNCFQGSGVSIEHIESVGNDLDRLFRQENN